MIRRGRSVALVSILLAAACSHGGNGTGDPAPRSSLAEDRSDGARAVSSQGAARPGRVPPGKLETIERHRYPSTSEEPIPDVAPGSTDAEGDLIKVEGQSGGKPGLVLLRAMDGAQALGYTIVVLDERAFYFVAEKRPGLIGQVLGGIAGMCKIAVGTEADPDTGASVVKLKGRAQTPSVRASCERDLQKLLQYARGEVIVKPKKPTRILEPEFNR
jgi:hypothetical protein